MSKKLLLFGWLFLSFVLLLYSFTQVDLGLTLTRVSIWTQIQKSFQYIGYFNRPLSGLIYGSIVVLLMGMYVWTLRVARSKPLDSKFVWKLIILLSIVLFFSYNAFSYDFFNYIFDAKIFTHYNENPYFKRALDYPGDPMLSFMHWTHRTYPYGPSWLLLTIPLSFFGAGYFIITFYLFKALVVTAYIGCVYFLEKILKVLQIKDTYSALLLFALNPLVIIESLISGHNDIVMMLFALISIYLLLRKRVVLAIVILLFSVGVKFATLFLLPLFVYVIYIQLNKKEIEKKIFAYLAIGGMVVPIILASARTNFQPWYLLFVLPFLPLLEDKRVVIPVYIMSFVGVIYYLPFLYTGNWDNPIPSILNVLVVVGIVLSTVLTLLYPYLKKR